MRVCTYVSPRDKDGESRPVLKPLTETMLSCSVVSDSATLWTGAHSPPGSSVCEVFSGKKTREGCYFPPPGDLPHPGIKPSSPVSPELQDDSLPAEPLGKSMVC